MPGLTGILETMQMYRDSIRGLLDCVKGLQTQISALKNRVERLESLPRPKAERPAKRERW